MGWHASDTHGLTFTDCRVPAENLLGERGSRLRQLPVGPRRRPGGHRRPGRRRDRGLPGRVRRATPRSATPSVEPIGANQAIAFKCADLAVMADAARALTYDAARLHDAGRPFKREAAVAKLYATEAAVTATREATQVFGGYGFMDETPVVALLPRLEDPRDRRGDQRDPAARDQPGARPADLTRGQTPWQPPVRPGHPTLRSDPAIRAAGRRGCPLGGRVRCYRPAHVRWPPPAASAPDLAPAAADLAQRRRRADLLLVGRRAGLRVPPGQRRRNASAG